MPSQSINSYFTPKYSQKLNFGNYFDFTLVGDEKDYDEEVVFSDDLIAINDGNRLPIIYDLSNPDTCPQVSMLFNNFYSSATLVSKNYYNPNNVDLNCISAFTGTCDVGLTATDNGLFTLLTGQTLNYTMGIRNDFKFNPYYYDRRMKMHMVTGYTNSPNIVFNGRPKQSMYNIVSVVDLVAGYHQQLYGGFYQGFYKLFGYDYEVFPERLNKGWTMETLIKPRNIDLYSIDTSTQEYLNTKYPNNAGTFFYFGTRAENKYYHYAGGSPESDSGYTRVTSGFTSLSSCTCYETGYTNANCVNLYPMSSTTAYHNIGCNCGGACTEQLPNPPLDPKFDVLSNALSMRFSGCPLNPSLCVKYIKITGDCVTTGVCETTGVTFQTGYTITEVCTPPIYDICDYVCGTITEDRWVMVTAVFERYTTIEECDLLNLGGLGDIREVTYQSILNGTSYNLIMPPETHSGDTKENKVYRIIFDRKWFDDTWYRLGRLKLYINGYLFTIIENFEEIIPRELNCEKEKQIGVPFNISWGGGSQGLHDNLIFKECADWGWSVGSGVTALSYISCNGSSVSLTGLTNQSGTISTQPGTTPTFNISSSANTLTFSGNSIPLNGPYQQDPEAFPNEILSASTYNSLTTDILVEQNFGGSFMGGISQFRMYTEPFSSPQVQHNFRILKDQFNLFDYWCPNCLSLPLPTPTPTPSPTPTPTPTPSPTPTPTPTPTPAYITAMAFPCGGEYAAEVISIPSQYQNLDNYYVVGATNGECYIVGGPTAGPSTITWDFQVYGQGGDCNLCPPPPTPVPCLATHLYLSSNIIFGVSGVSITNDYSAACNGLACLQASTCSYTGSYSPFYMDTATVQVGTVFYGNATTCNYYTFSGWYIVQNSGSYVLISLSNGIVTTVLSSCPSNYYVTQGYVDGLYFE